MISELEPKPESQMISRRSKNPFTPRSNFTSQISCPERATLTSISAQPAYKGVPLATATVDKLTQLDGGRFGNVSYSFNRKEIKDHGEGGVIVGAPLRGKNVVIIDDVITAGTAMREAIEIIRAQGGKLVGVIVALDRKERMNDESSGSAIGEVRKEFGVPVLSIIDLDDLIGVLGGLGDEEDMERLREYKRRYGASD